MPAGSGLLLSTSLVRPTSAFVEWLAWHRMMGAHLVNVLIDRRQAAAHPLLSALETAGLVRIVPVGVDPDMKEEPHNSALRAGAIEGEESGGHGLFLGPDEYFRIHSTARTIASLMRGAGGADVMSVPVCEGGTGGHEHHAPGPVLHMTRPVAVPGAGAALRSVVRLGLFSSRTPEVPVGPVAGDAPVRWTDGSGTPLPAPQSRVAWARAGHAPGMARASVLRIAAPASETLLLRAQHLPPKQRPGSEALLARLADLAAIEGPEHALGARAAALGAQIAELMALPGVAEAQAAIEAGERETLKQILPAAEPAILPAAEAPAREAGATDEDAPAPDPALPEWFAEIHTGGDRQGFYTRLEHHAVMCIRRDPARLVVTFDNLSNVNDLSPGREPWAYRFVRENGASHLSVMARRKDWYRCPQLIAYLEKLSGDGLFAEFGQIWLTGTSMGGFAALAFASLAPGATVIAFNPQTTLDETLVPWEERFGMGRARDWSLPYSDAAFEIDEVARAFVLYDPFFAPDRRHVERLEGDNVTPLKTWCSGHFSPVFLRRANLLKPVMQHALDGTLTPAVFYRLYRDRRLLPWYRKALQANLQERGHERLARIVSPAFQKLRREAAE
ncbi:hypothetical protein [Roseovarius ramblicola]|uniref:Glycosyl transferase family 2 n=1 Tax=Roseovarius ramblicola TaxID=2022336 RepID=A0ABV5HZN0_9RHOB